MRFIIFTILIISIFAWAGFGYMVWAIPPKIGGELALTNFLYALALGFIGLWSTLSILIYLVLTLVQPKKRIVDTHQPTKKIFWSAFRRAFLVSTLVSGLIALNVFTLLNLLNVSLLAGILILIEIYFTSR